MKQTARWMKTVLTTVLVVAVTGFVAQARAADLPLAAASPLSGVSFDDRPLLLPLQRNFQMAMLTAGSELGRSCGKMEAYGWRMSQTEQGRVNQIFNNTVDRLRLLGYTIAPQTLTSVSKDITLFTADRSNKHFMFLWSAGELGLVLNLCETSAPIPAAHHATSVSPSVQVFPMQMDAVVPTRLDALNKAGSRGAGGFSPIGEWEGGYTCAQGYTGGKLQIAEMHGENFEGVFKFYPTAKNPSVPPGAYTVYGQYDRESKRILINPGKWIKRPHSFYDTVIVGSFDSVHDTFSAYFQGVSGCTSFEAHREGGVFTPSGLTKHKVAKHIVKKKKAKAKASAKASGAHSAITMESLPALSPQDAAVADGKKDAVGIVLAAPSATTSVATPSASAPVAPAPVAAPAAVAPPVALTPAPAAKK